MSVHAHIRMIEIMYKVGLIKECLKYLLISLSIGLYLLPYGTLFLEFDTTLSYHAVYNCKGVQKK